jgi:hypothetical protein
MGNTTKNFNYPSDDYYNFKHGNPMSNGIINAWIKDCIDKLKADAKKFPKRNDFHHSISSGSTKVLIEGYRQGDKSLLTIYVSVIDGYDQLTETNVKL